jgi:mono/diheme cytochrome c family protein
VAGLAAALLAAGGCGGGGDDETGADRPRAPRPHIATDIPAPPGTTAQGRHAFLAAGCLGCHRFRGVGNRLAPDLTHVGARRDAREIEDILIDPPAPMPSFALVRKQHPRDFRAIVDFLAAAK